MQGFTYRTWETMSPLSEVQETTYYRIYDDRQYAEQGINEIWSGVVLPGYKLEHLENILTQYVRPSQPEYMVDYRVFTDSRLDRAFYITVSTDNTIWTLDYAITIIYDWTYKPVAPNPSQRPVIQTRTQPLVVDPRQYFMVTTHTYDPYNEIYIARNMQQVMTFSCETYKFKTGMLNLYAYSFQDGDELRVIHRYYTGSTTYIYKVQTTCNRYCFYYINKSGGWDTFLINGKELQKDKMNNYSFKQNFNRIMVTEPVKYLSWGNTIYRRDITEQWELNTGWVNDEVSDRVVELLQSPIVYLHDMEEDTVVPVIVTNNTVEHKTFKNQNRRLSQYVINVEASQEKHVE